MGRTSRSIQFAVSGIALRLSERLFDSIGVRLSIQLSLLFLLFAAACAGLIGYQLSNIDETARSLRLQDQAREIRQALHFTTGAAPAPELPPERMARYQGEKPVLFYALRNAAGDLVEASSRTLQAGFGARLFRGIVPGESDTIAKDGPSRISLVLPTWPDGQNQAVATHHHRAPACLAPGGHSRRWRAHPYHRRWSRQHRPRSAPAPMWP